MIVGSIECLSVAVLLGGVHRRGRRTSQCSPSCSVTRTRSPASTVGGAADDRRAVGVPAHRVAAREHGERAEILQPSGQHAEARVGALARRAARRRAAARRRRCSRPRIAASRRRRSCASSRCRSDADTRARCRASRASAARRKLVRQLRGVPAAHREPRRASRRGRGGAVERVHAPRGAAGGRCRAAACSRCCSRSMRLQNSSFAATTISAAADGVGARRSATKSAIVTSDFVADRRDRPAPGDAAIARATDLLVERPEILDRAAAAPDDDDVHARRPCRSRAAPRATRAAAPSPARAPAGSPDARSDGAAAGP